LSYEPKLDAAKPAASTACKDTFGSSKVERTIKWDEEIKQKEYTRDKNVKPHKSSLVGAPPAAYR